MLLLLGIGFVAGVITAVSPCVLPVLPIVLAGGATSGARRRPYAIATGLVASFTTFTLVASLLLSALGLPQDLLRNLAIALLFVLAASLLYPRLALLLERPLFFLTRRRVGDAGSGFLLGIGLGLVFVPCAGPVLATVTVLAAQHRFGFDLVALTLAYAIGASLPLLAIAVGGRHAAARLRSGSRLFRPAMGIVLAGAAVAIVFNVDRGLQTRLGGYTTALQKHVELTGTARSRLATLRGDRPVVATAVSASLPDYGSAPAFAGISHWLNTPGDRALTLASLRGKVVLVDFWTYSCINCLRTLPHLHSLYATYHGKGLEIVGIHTPEFAFEHELSNVRTATHDLGVTWPVGLDNDYATWNAYSNEYWPAEYLVDRRGRLRHAQFGEGDYGGTEHAIRELLGDSRGAHAHPVRDTTPNVLLSPETYLGYGKLDGTRYAGGGIAEDEPHTYSAPATLEPDGFAFGGSWTVGRERAVTGRGALVRFHVHARDVYLVLGGRGSVRVRFDGRQAGTVRVTGDRLYTLLSGRTLRDGQLEASLSPGLAAYSFTFG